MGGDLGQRGSDGGDQFLRGPRFGAAQELSPLHHVRLGLPPTLVLHGVRDTITPVAGAKAFADAMTKAGNHCELILNERGNHSYMMRTQPLFDEAMQQTTDFLAKCGIAVAVPNRNSK